MDIPKADALAVAERCCEDARAVLRESEVVESASGGAGDTIGSPEVCEGPEMVLKDERGPRLALPLTLRFVDGRGGVDPGNVEVR